ncbi:MAG: SDR family oxidoreductase [Sandaracinaceae bacterium]|nr:SDR family oxidoreductase [Sandaracinaceae bacterium]
MSRRELSAETIWITGATSGIGEALAYELSEKGARLILSARRSDSLEHVRSRCAHPERHRVLPLDLSQPDTLIAAAREALAWGPIDVLVNNGGVSQRSLAKDTALVVDRTLMETNFFGTVALTKAVLPSMIARKRGQIVVVSSLVGKFGTPLRSSYAASKHALHGFFDALRAELNDEGITVTIICPGFIKTNVSINALTGDGTAQGKVDRSLKNGGMSAEECAKRMVLAIQRSASEVIIAGREGLGVYLKRYAPAVFEKAITRVKVT